MMKSMEANFDGLIGPTHFYGGLALGNVASINNARDVSNPKAAALQGLAKMKALADLGLVQGVLPPHERPATWVLRELGFQGSDQQVLAAAHRTDPELVAACFSASAMWAANAATVSPATDTADGKVHFTPANLSEKFHRSFEKTTTKAILETVFPEKEHFIVHEPLPAGRHFRDEGAANHTRFCSQYDAPGVELFVYGASNFKHTLPSPQRFPARQTLEAAQAIARKHQLDPSRTIFAQQNPAVIDAGVFHNDVISVGNENVFFYHEHALLNSQDVLHAIAAKLDGPEFFGIEVKDHEISVTDAVNSYLFNSQLVTLAPGQMCLICPTECQENQLVNDYLSTLVNRSTPIKAVKYFDLKQSMRNGGGPACLRLRVVLNQAQLVAVNQACLLDDDLYSNLIHWVERHYRDRLSAEDFLDPQLVEEVRIALTELTKIMRLGDIYPFQQ